MWLTHLTVLALLAALIMMTKESEGQDDFLPDKYAAITGPVYTVDDYVQKKIQNFLKSRNATRMSNGSVNFIRYLFATDEQVRAASESMHRRKLPKSIKNSGAIEIGMGHESTHSPTSPSDMIANTESPDLVTEPTIAQELAVNDSMQVPAMKIGRSEFFESENLLSSPEIANEKLPVERDIKFRVELNEPSMFTGSPIDTTERPESMETTSGMTSITESPTSVTESMRVPISTVAGNAENIIQQLLRRKNATSISTESLSFLRNLFDSEDVKVDADGDDLSEQTDLRTPSKLPIVEKNTHQGSETPMLKPNEKNSKEHSDHNRTLNLPINGKLKPHYSESPTTPQPDEKNVNEGSNRKMTSNMPTFREEKLRVSELNSPQQDEKNVNEDSDHKKTSELPVVEKELERTDSLTSPSVFLSTTELSKPVTDFPDSQFDDSPLSTSLLARKMGYPSQDKGGSYSVELLSPIEKTSTSPDSRDSFDILKHDDSVRTVTGKCESSVEGVLKAPSGILQWDEIQNTLTTLLNDDNGEFEMHKNERDMVFLLVDTLRKEFPKEILTQLGMSDYVEKLHLNDYIGVDNFSEVLTIFKEMYTKVLKKLGLRTANDQTDGIEGEAISTDVWKKVGYTTVEPFVNQLYSTACDENISDIPAPDAVMKLLLEIPLDITDKIIDTSHKKLDTTGHIEDERGLLTRVSNFVHSLPESVLDRLVLEYGENKPFFNMQAHSVKIDTAMRDLADTLVLLSVVPIGDLSRYETNSLKDKLFLTFLITDMDDKYSSDPITRAIMKNAMRIPKKILKNIVENISLLLTMSPKFLSPLQLLPHEVVTQLKALSSLPFDYTYDVLAMKYKAGDGRSSNDNFDAENSSSALIEFLGLQELDISFRIFIDFLTELSTMSQQMLSTLLEDLSVRLNPFSSITDYMHSTEQTIRNGLEAIYHRYPIKETTELLRKRFLSFLGYSTANANTDSAPATNSVWNSWTKSMRRFPDNLLLNFKETFSPDDKDAESFVTERKDPIVVSSKEMNHMFVNYIKDSADIDDEYKPRIISSVLEDKASKGDSGFFETITSWWTDDKKEVEAGPWDQLTGFWSDEKKSHAKISSEKDHAKDLKEEKDSWLSGWFPWMTSNKDTNNRNSKGDLMPSNFEKNSKMSLKNIMKSFLKNSGSIYRGKIEGPNLEKIANDFSSMIDWNISDDTAERRSDEQSYKYETLKKEDKENLQHVVRNNGRRHAFYKSVDPVGDAKVKDLLLTYKMLSYPVRLLKAMRKSNVMRVGDRKKLSKDYNANDFHVDSFNLIEHGSQSSDGRDTDPRLYRRARSVAPSQVDQDPIQPMGDEDHPDEPVKELIRKFF